VSFHNLTGESDHRFITALRWMMKRRRPRWPRHVVNDPADRPAARVDDGGIRVTLVGHSTVLVQMAGLNILTDPVWSRRVGPMPGIGVRRVRPPALSLAELPPIDVVLVSHNHYDHLDRPTLAALAKRHRPLLLTGRNVGKALPRRAAARMVELDWWQSHEIAPGVTVHYVPAEHFSARTPFDRNATLWGGFVVESKEGRVYFAGDTGDGPHFAQIRERLGPMTLSLLPIGAYTPRWFMSPVHINPAEAVAASLTLESQVSLAMHYGTFPLADDGFDDPPRDLAVCLKDHPNLDFRQPAFGRATVIRRR